jgi:PAS domain S-box-containing protein
VRVHPSDQGLAVYFQNVTDERRTLERVSEQAALIDQASDAIFVRDMEHRITFWSRGAERVFGWTASEVVGRRVNVLLHLNDDVFAAAERAVLETGEWHGEYEKTAKNGALLALDGRWTLLRDEHGLPRSILTFDSDITERRKLELQFLRTQRMESIGTLAGGIAHDLNNVLSPILMSVGLLKDGERSPDRLSILDAIETSALRGADMVRQVLAFARGVEGRPLPTNLLTIVRDVQRIIRDTFPKNIDLAVEADDTPWTIDADATQLHQVLMNLCVNARDAMPHGGQLTIGVENLTLGAEAPALGVQRGPSVMLRVTDTGMGMSRAVQDRIFDPFFTTKEIGKGTGLGLSTVLTIVRTHRGHINVYSEPGRGTTFKIYLPGRIVASASDTAVAEEPPLPHGHGEVVLVVDDEEGIRTLTRRILERFGYHVMLAANGAEAVAMYAQHRREIAVVLTDMAMPVMDGLATIVALRAMDPQVKIVGSSGHAANQGVAEALGAGVHHFIPKPYTAEAMVRVMDQVLGRAGGTA